MPANADKTEVEDVFWDLETKLYSVCTLNIELTYLGVLGNDIKLRSTFIFTTTGEIISILKAKWIKQRRQRCH
jgi:hypothetical protein